MNGVCLGYLGVFCETAQCPSLYNDDVTCDNCYRYAGCEDCLWHKESFGVETCEKGYVLGYE